MNQKQCLCKANKRIQYPREFSIILELQIPSFIKHTHRKYIIFHQNQITKRDRVRLITWGKWITRI